MQPRARRIQLSADEKKVMAEKINADRSDENLLFLVNDWNEQHPERRINWNHLKRIRDDIHDSSDIHTGGILGVCPWRS